MKVSTAKKQGKKVIFGSEETRKTRRIKEGLEELGFDCQSVFEPEKLLELECISESYVESVRAPGKSMNYHLRKGSSRIDRNSFVDWWTLNTESEVEELREQFLEEFKNVLPRIKEKADIEPELESEAPFVGRHGLKKLIGDRLWELKKESSKNLSEFSRRALKNGESGRRFERFFRELCEDEGFECYRKTAAAFREFMPEKFHEVRSIMGSMRGIPDFLVDKKNSESLGNWLGTRERFWEPENRFAFVEVKYNSSRMSKVQRKMAEALGNVGAEVSVFKGEFDSYRVERVC